jgi:hypothetical protein
MLEGPRSDDPAKQAAADTERRAPDSESRTPDDSTSASALDRFLPHSLRTGRRRVFRGDEQDALNSTKHARAELPRQPSGIGAHVDLILAAADQAAEQIRRDAEQTLRDAQAEAAKVRAEAAREATEMVTDCERRGKEIEGAARDRADELAKETDAVEARLDELLTTVRGLTDQLERRLARDVGAAADAGSESLDETLARRRATSGETV